MEEDGYTPIMPQYFADYKTAKHCRDYMNRSNKFNYTKVCVITLKTKER